MKVAIYLLDAVVTGTTALAFHLRDGFVAAGHECDTIASSKSGKETVRWSRADGGAQWWMRAPDLTVQHSELVQTLNRYDLVIVNDVGSSTLDSKGWPEYAEALIRTKTPWTVVAHGNKYDERHAPHFAKMKAASRNYSGRILACTAPYSYDEHPLFSDSVAIPIRRPYVAQHLMDDELPTGPFAGTLGRFSTGKNLHVLGLTLPYFNDAQKLLLGGACISSARPTDAFQVYERLMELDCIGSMEEPYSMNKTATWAVKDSRTNAELRYLGSYTQPLVELEQMRLFVNVTSPTFSAGTEYATMEAFDAGCVVLSSKHFIDEGSAFAYAAMDSVELPSSVKAAAREGERNGTFERLAQRIEASRDMTEHTREQLARHNRMVLSVEHNPVSIATFIASNF